MTSDRLCCTGCKIDESLCLLGIHNDYPTDNKALSDFGGFLSKISRIFEEELSSQNIAGFDKRNCLRPVVPVRLDLFRKKNGKYN